MPVPGLDFAPPLSWGARWLLGSRDWEWSSLWPALPRHPLLAPFSPSLAGIDFKIRTVDIDGKKIKLQVW